MYFKYKVAMAGFRFKQFSVEQELCAMKVGTDGCLLGAWVACREDDIATVLDIGTGTGLISLMMAQRFLKARITAIDIDEGAVEQARINVEASRFAERIEMRKSAVQDFSGKFDAIVSNPPYFVDALECPDSRRNMARHANTLSYSELMHSAYRMLNDDGEFSVIIPADYRSKMEAEAAIAGFHQSRVCAVFTSMKRPAKRYMLAFKKRLVPVESTSLVIDSDEFKTLLKDFYLKY